MNIEEKLKRAIDPNNDYSMDDFNKEIIDGKIINVVNQSENEVPSFKSNEASGFDIRANEDLILEYGKYKTIKTGLYFEIPSNLEMQIRPRSGLAAKHGVTVLNSPGTIDSDYRGEIKIILINHSTNDFKINVGDRIAQGVFTTPLKKLDFKFKIVDKLKSDTERSNNGFGSTGIK